MQFIPTPIAGAFLLKLEPRADTRGFFSRTSCQDELAEHGLNNNFFQQSISWNPKRGTLRGMHFQAQPHMEDKLVRVTRGSAFDVFLDMRPNSPTCGKWHGEVLSADNRLSFYIPKGCAHGYQILENDTEVFYQMTERYQPTGARGIAWNDPVLAIKWPLEFDAADVHLLSEADRNQPSWEAVKKTIGAIN
jgi:dTDP-4-dehydrorhamnose 3,5-epimerase